MCIPLDKINAHSVTFEDNGSSILMTTSICKNSIRISCKIFFVIKQWPNREQVPLK